MKYEIVLYPSEEGYAVECPALPGCASQGATREEAIANIQEAIRDYLEVRVELMTAAKAEFADVAKVESEPRLEGRQMVMVLSPR